jgi:hypothetical protein
MGEHNVVDPYNGVLFNHKKASHSKLALKTYVRDVSREMFETGNPSGQKVISGCWGRGEVMESHSERGQCFLLVAQHCECINVAETEFKNG